MGNLVEATGPACNRRVADRLGAQGPKTLLTLSVGSPAEAAYGWSMSHASGSAPVLDIDVEDREGARQPVSVAVDAVFNFGYAARDQDGLKAHLDETAAMGLPIPDTVPSLYSLPPDRVTTATELVVCGNATYAEVEYALILDRDGRWLITVASDHTDVIVEKGDVARGKAMAPDVLAPVAWPLDDVEAHADEMILRCQLGGDEAAEVQRGTLGSLLAARQLIATLARRCGQDAGPGTVILSGTIGGEPRPGGAAWRIGLEDPVLGRTLEHAYGVRALAAELPERAWS
jgi:Protein of unknown function (DUF2848)